MGTTSTLDLTTLRAFIAVVERGGVSSAARALGVPKSSVSRALAAFEHEAGQRLVVRTTRSFTPTEAGRALAARCRTALEELEGAFASLRGEDRAPEGVVRVTMPTLVATACEKELISTFLTRFPQVRLELACTNRMVDLAAEGIDLAVRVGELPDSSMSGRRLGEVRTVLVASPGYLDRTGRPRKASDLAAHQCLVFHTSDAASAVWPVGGEVTRVKGPVHADHLPLLHSLAVSGAGIAWLPRFLVRDDLEQGRLRRVLPGLVVRGPPVWLVSTSGKRPSSASRAFAKHASLRLPVALGLQRRV